MTCALRRCVGGTLVAIFLLCIMSYSMGYERSVCMCCVCKCKKCLYADYMSYLDRLQLRCLIHVCIFNQPMKAYAFKTTTMFVFKFRALKMCMMYSLYKSFNLYLNLILLCVHLRVHRCMLKTCITFCDGWLYSLFT